MSLCYSKPDLAENARQGLNKLLANEVPIEIKPVNPPHFYRRAATQPKQQFWVRARGHIGNSWHTRLTCTYCSLHTPPFLLTGVGEGNMKLHCCVAAYVSDYAFLGTALLPYPNYRVKFLASLDHAMWFHSTFRSDEWMLYECESPWAGQWEYYLSAVVSGQRTSTTCDVFLAQGAAGDWFRADCGEEMGCWL